jgi:hypothetical protein
LISVLKRNAQEGRGLTNEALRQSIQQTEDILGNEQKLKSYGNDPAFKDALRRMNNLSLIEKATLLGNYVPSVQASRQLDEMQRQGADINRWLNQQPQPQQPMTPKDWADADRVQRFHSELNQMINGAYLQWQQQAKPAR